MPVDLVVEIDIDPTVIEVGSVGVPGVPGVNGTDGREVLLQKSATHIQWKYDTDLIWTNLILLSDLTGAPGVNGLPGDDGDDGLPGDDGDDGREIELQNNTTYIQWRYVGGAWTNLVLLSDLKGDAGTPGLPGLPGPNEVSTTTDTDITGILKGDGSHVSVATLNVDYQAPLGFVPAISGHVHSEYLEDAPITGSLYGRSSGNWTEVVIASGIINHSELNELDYYSSGHMGFLEDTTDIINNTHIDWGTGANQVSTADVPEETNLYYTDERVDDRVSDLIRDGTGIFWDYNDGAGTLTPTISGFEPIDSTIVRTGQTNYIDLTDGGSTNLHIHPAPAPAQHDIVGAIHSVTGAAGQLVGLSALNTLGLVSPAPSLLGNGAMQYQTIITGANPFVPVYSGFLLDGTTGGKTVFAVTNAKTLTLTSTDDFNLTIPATGTAAMLNQANSFTLINPLTTIAESWIGPSSTAGIYFKGDNVGIGTTTPSRKLDVAGVSVIGTVAFTGGGLNDATLGGTFTGNITQTLRIKIATAGTPDKFDWSINGGSTWVATGVSITAGAIALNYTGVTVTFGATTGHTVNNYWQATLTPATGIANISGGYYIGNVLFAGITGTENIGIGIGPFGGGKNTGYGNVALGYRALYSNSTGYHNSAIGYQALYSNSTGYYNSAIGYQTLYSNSTGSSNSAIGYQTLYSNSTGSSNVAQGISALYYNTTGYRNVAQGTTTLYSNTTGYENIAQGTSALYSNTTGYYNAAQGAESLYANTTGNYNSAIGWSALWGNSTGNYNSAIGFYALYSVRPTSDSITAFANYGGTVAGTVKATSNGHGLLGTTTKEITGTVNYNGSKSVTVIDVNNFYFTATWVADETKGWWSIVSEGTKNVGIGNSAGRTLTKGDSCTFIGNSAGYHGSQLVTAANSTAIGNGAYTAASNQIVLGNTSVTTFGIGTYNPTAHIQFTGVSDLIGLRVLGNATQTTNVLSLETSAAAVNISMDNNGGAIFNEQGNATGDFRVESDNQANMLFLDASADILYLGGTTNGTRFAANGDQSFIGTAGFYPRVLNQSSAPAAGTGATQCDTGEFIVWEDADNTETWLVYNRGGTVKGIKIETI